MLLSTQKELNTHAAFEHICGRTEPGFAVIDLETTGFSRSSRILEIGIVLLDAQAHPEGFWRTLVQPECGFNNSHIHHITATDLVKAPTFAQIAQRLAQVLQGRILVAHNAPFERRFLEHEFARAGLELPQGTWLLDTQALSRRLLPGAPRSLSECIAAIGVNNSAAHTALADAVATAQLWAELLRRHPRLRSTAEPLMCPTEQLAALADSEVACLARQDGLCGSAASGPLQAWSEALIDASSSAESAWLFRLITAMPATGDAASDRYCAALAQAMVDGRLSTQELEQLNRVATAQGLAAEDISELHEHYLTQLVVEAWADGVVAERERCWLERIAEQLSIDTERFHQLLAQPAEDTYAAGADGEHAEVCALAPGDRVSFTGALVTPRDTWEARAREAGLSVGGVIRASRLVVAADVHTMSRKATKARELGVQIIDEVGFARALAAMMASISSTEKDSEAERQKHSLGEVFPWLDLGALSGCDTLSIVQAWLARDSTTPLGELSPYLRTTMVPEGRMWARARSLLNTPPDSGVTQVSAQQLADLPGIGRVRLQKLISEVVLLALDEYEAGGTADAAGIEAATPRPETLAAPDTEERSQSALLDWLALSGTATLVTTQTEALPESVAAEIADLPKRAEQVVRAACAEIAEVLASDERLGVILDERLVGEATLQELGDRFDVSRERVRQLERDLCASLAAIGPACALVQAALRGRVGAARRATELYRELPALELAPEGIETDLLRILPLVGEPGAWGVECVEFTDCEHTADYLWFSRAGFIDAVDEAIASAADAYGVIALETLAEAAGAEVELMREWVEVLTPYVIYKEHVLSRTESVVARACGVLQVEGEPMTSEQLHAVLPDRSMNSIDNALAAAEVVQRCGRRTWALREWGKQEWTTIADFIANRLAQANAEDPERSRGVALQELIEEATGYGVSPNSVRVYADTGDFVLDNGQVRYRSSEEAVVNDAQPEQTRGLYLRDGEWQLLLSIHHDHVRGSGTAVDRGVLALYDVAYGESVLIPSRLGEQRLTWGKTNAALGTISRFIRDLELEEGDRAWLHFGSNFDITRAPALREDAEGLVKLINRMGADEQFLDAEGALAEGVEPTAVIGALNLAIGLDADCPRRTTVRRLRDRGDDPLAELVRAL
ncbi:DNA polymerase III subunit epsilon [Corynebacterium ciconiae DSM 44920]|uniref:exonuclease domain-containing protein n=1 Tax=Corynebacterium ciconiae TaxID=227319 RepID=UPI00037EAF2E|nr:exonuclease domain-containing protein [Corynebacterium ciconiae]WKD61571.1 DNA polymerase III subunit epsilon [Corynebacterium ciconiae DSM 44920]